MDERDFAEIVKRTKKTVLSAIGKNLSPRFSHAIDDVTQETYLRAYKGLVRNSFRNESTIETWLYKIARNESLRINQRLSREEEKIKKVKEAKIFAHEDDFDEISFLSDRLSLLPEKYKLVLELAAQGYNTDDISNKLGIRPGTVKSRASRGKKLIRQNIEREDHERA